MIIKTTPRFFLSTGCDAGQKQFTYGPEISSSASQWECYSTYVTVNKMLFLLVLNYLKSVTECVIFIVFDFVGILTIRNFFYIEVKCLPMFNLYSSSVRNLGGKKRFNLFFFCYLYFVIYTCPHYVYNFE